MNRHNRKYLERLWVILGSACFGLQFGFNYGVSNQNTYFVRGLQMLHPELFKNDWLVSRCTDYHHYFSYLVKLGLALDPSGWIFGIANVMTAFLGGLIIYGIVSEMAGPKCRLPAFFLTLAALAVTKSNSVAGSYIFSLIFQPSTLGALGVLAALWFFLKGRYLGSGCCLAAGGFFHGNYLILGFALFFIAQGLLGGQGLVGRWVRQFAFPAISLAFLLPILLKTAFSETAREGALVWINIRAQHHHLPASFGRQFIPFAGWIGMAAAMGWRQWRTPSWAAYRAAYAAFVFLIAAATLLTTAVFLPQVSMLFVWRLSPFSDLMSQIVIFAALVKTIAEPDETRLPWPAGVLLLLGLVLVGWHYGRAESWFVIILAAALGGALAWRRLLPGRRISAGAGQTAAAVIALGIWIFLTYPSLLAGIRNSSLVRGFPKDEVALFQWARTTPAGAVFLVPPMMDNFRFSARRAIVVDWKSTPAPDEMVEWRRRMSDVIGVPDFFHYSQIDPGYDQMDMVRLRKLAGKYNVAYVVLKSGTAAEVREKCPVVFADASYVVCRIPPGATNRTLSRRTAGRFLPGMPAAHPDVEVKTCIGF